MYIEQLGSIIGCQVKYVGLKYVWIVLLDSIVGCDVNYSKYVGPQICVDPTVRQY